MKVRLIWRYTDSIGFWGTCAKWAAGIPKANGPVKKERVIWAGKIPECYECTNGWH